ncbi:hypothetical protein DXG01_009309 [Tephrocybe rancida]|nr:hypothetical protein DXG01_009309 [Tephrocybe rancida]
METNPFISTRMKMDLPDEVQELIIDHLSDDKPTLLVCRLVSLLWLVRIRRWLFHDVWVGESGSEDDLDLNAVSTFSPRNAKAVDISLLQSPHSKLGPSIRTLTITGPDYIPCMCCGDIYAGKPSEYDDLSAAIEAALPFMDYVSKLKLQTFEFPCLSSQAQGAIMSLSQVKTLDIFGITYRSIEEMLAPFQHVTELRVCSINIGVELDRHIMTESPPAAWPLPFPLPPLISMSSLTSLETSAGDYYRDLLSSDRYILAQNIEKLSFDGAALRYVPEIGEFIKATGASLKYLRMYFQADGYDAFPISLAENINLSTFEMSSNHFSNDVWWLAKIMPTMPRTTQVKIEVWINAIEEVLVVEDFGSADIETFFAYYADIPLSLRLTPTTGFIKDVDAPWLTEFIRAKLPEISRRGLVQICTE